MDVVRVALSALLSPIGYMAVRKHQITHDADGMILKKRNVDFLTSPRFARAYKLGVATDGGRQGPGANARPKHYWRVAICCWAAEYAKHLDGDFVECGVAAGMTSRAVCDYINFNATGKSLWLFDTYNGIPLEQIAADEDPKWRIRRSRRGFFDCYDLVVSNFAAFPKAHVVRGTVPDTLSTVEIDKVAYLHLDMNIEYPERAAFEHFWPKLVDGGIIIFDDYGFMRYTKQKRAADEIAKRYGLEVWTLPSGQGLLIKPPTKRSMGSS